jgi:hypothetical protein
MKNIYNWMGILSLLILASCSNIDENNEQTVDVESITFQGITNDSIYLKKGDKYQLSVTTVPANSPVKFYNTTSEAFKVNQSTGEVTALAGGVGTVIAIAPNGDSWTKAYCHVNVTQYVEQIQLDQAYKINMLDPDDMLDVSPFFTALPYMATNKTLTYESSDPAIVTVDSDGFVTYVSKGYAEVTAKAVDGSNVSSEPIQFYVGYVTEELSKNPAWTATASSSECDMNSGYFCPALAIDGVVGGLSFWFASLSIPAEFPIYFQIDFGVERTFSGVQVFRKSSPNMYVKDVEFYIIPADITTESGITWTDHRYVQWGRLSFSGSSVSGDTKSKLFQTFPKTVTSRYLMLKLPNTTMDGLMCIEEIMPCITH